MKQLIIWLSAGLIFTMAGPGPGMAADQDWNEKGLFFKRSGQYQKAADAFSKALEASPEDADIFNNRGAVCYYQEEWDKAISDYTRAIDLEPRNASFYINRGAAWFKKGDYSKSIRDYTKVIELDPKSSDGYNNRGMVFYFSGEFERAVADHTKALELTPEADEVYNNRGAAWFRMENYERALVDYSRALSLNARSFNALKNRGIVWFKKGFFDRAVRDYTRALELAPESVSVHVSRGIAFYEQQDYSKAILDFLDAVTAGPEDADALNQLAWMLAVCPESRYRNGGKAVEYARKAVTLYPSLNTLDTLAAALAETGDFSEAEAEQKRIITLAREKTSKIPSHYLDKLDAYASGKPWRADSIIHATKKRQFPLTGKVRASAGNIRSEPDLGAIVIDKMPKDKKVTLLGKEGPWYLIELGPNLFGWAHEVIFGPVAVKTAVKSPVPKDGIGLAPILAPIADSLKVRVAMGRIREGPDMTSAVLYRVQKGKHLVLLEQKGDWYKVSLGRGRIGWANRSLFH